MKFNITNTTIDKDELVVYYTFENNEKNSQRFKKTSKVTDILDWGTKRGKFFEDRELEIKRLKVEADKLAEELNNQE